MTCDWRNNFTVITESHGFFFSLWKVEKKNKSILSLCAGICDAITIDLDWVPCQVSSSGVKAQRGRGVLSEKKGRTNCINYLWYQSILSVLNIAHASCSHDRCPTLDFHILQEGPIDLPLNLQLFFEVEPCNQIISAVAPYCKCICIYSFLFVL